jgi:hypothetical protein
LIIRIPTSLLTLPICSCMLPILSIKALNVVLFVLL